jgi:hypothetical protein
MKPLVEWVDLSPSCEVRSIEPNEITILGEWSGVDLATARVPGFHHLLIEASDVHLVSRLRGWWLGYFCAHDASLCEQGSTRPSKAIIATVDVEVICGSRKIDTVARCVQSTCTSIRWMAFLRPNSGCLAPSGA